jgi:hypothetical protein
VVDPDHPTEDPDEQRALRPHDFRRVHAVLRRRLPTIFERVTIFVH